MKFIFGSEENPDETGRLDAVLAEHTVGKFTRSTVAKLIKMGKVKLNGKKEESKATKLKVGVRGWVGSGTRRGLRRR